MASGKVEESYPVSQGVKYSKYTYGTKSNSINHLAIDLGDKFTKLTLGIPKPINTLMTTTAHANKNSAEGNRVVGAINANFYNMSDGYPLYLLAENNKILTPEVISDGSEYYVNQPYAFGVTKNGNAEIAYYNADITVNYKGKQQNINGFNVRRGSDEAIVYMPTHHSSRTPNNEYGMEFVVETDKTIGTTNFGQTYSGKVTKIRQYGDKTTSTIPRNGFVLSFNGGKWGDEYRDIKVGDDISVSFSVSNVWKDAQYMMTSGPLLVLDGKKQISMSTSSSRASQVTARSAIAISKDKKTVHLVTVDSTGGKGMNLNQFADYLVSLGVDRAINLDGGGSTTMGIRKYGSNTVVVANQPSGGSERRVSAILQAVSTAKTGEAKRILIRRDKIGTMLVGTKITLTPSYILDEHYNPISYKNSDIKVVSQNGNVTVSGLSYTAKKAGNDRIVASLGKAVQTFAVTVVDAPSTIAISGKTSIETAEKTQLKATPKLANGSNLLYNTNQVKWSVDSNIGTISSDGVFTSNGKIGKATVTATIGAKSVKQQIEVKESYKGDVFAIDNFESLTNISTSTALAKSTIALDSKVFKNNKYALKLTYDMTGNESGTAAAYVRFGDGSMPSKPKKIGVWLYGNSGRTWVRGVVRDADGVKHTVDFTENGGQTWTGWKYVETNVPKTEAYPLSMETIYLVQPDVSLQQKGTVYFDKLQAIYNDKYVEPMFTDISDRFPYKNEIHTLVNRGYIAGYDDGTFKPKENLTRVDAAIAIVRALNLDTSNVTNPNFKDVSTNHPYYREIAAIENAGIMTGVGGNFNINRELTRSQMAKILVEGYNLKGTSTKTFSDVPKSYSGYHYINALAATGVTDGYPDGTFGINRKVTRQHFSAFLYRIIEQQK
ncbi:MAG: S-layer homology domain-containing protein [Lysinibacillus sp.]